MNVLLLGGTRDAINIAHSLLALNESGEPQIALTYSIAGIVRQPTINCSIHSGGFSQYSTDKTGNHSQQGMKQFILQQNIEKVIDATHPFAVTISSSAAAVCEQLAIPLFKYVRPPWQATEQDNWINVSSWTEAKQAINSFKRPLITIGRVASDDLDSIPKHQFWTIRSAVEESQAQDQYSLLKAIGPFAEAEELELLQNHHIDVVVCKNSGGSAVDGKLRAARKLSLPVIMINRPETGSCNHNLYDNEYKLIKAIC